VAAIGVNCTAPGYVAGLVSAIRTATGKPIVVYPNSGETYQADDNSRTGDTEASEFAKLAHVWHEHGARIIGGCCRTTPAQIRAVARWRGGREL
jgi:homocysteine S-methyltransferase